MEMGNHYTRLGTHESFYNTQTCENKPKEGQTYDVWASDPLVIIFMEEGSRLKTAEILSPDDDADVNNDNIPAVPQPPKEGDIPEEESSEESSGSEDKAEVHLRGEQALELIWN